MAGRMNRVDLQVWTVKFHRVVTKIAEGAKTPDCDIRLTHDECKVLAQALQLLSKKEPDNQ